MGFLSLLLTHSLSASMAELTMCIQETVQIKLEFIRDLFIEMKICLVPVSQSWYPTHGLCNLKHLHIHSSIMRIPQCKSSKGNIILTCVSTGKSSC